MSSLSAGVEPTRAKVNHSRACLFGRERFPRQAMIAVYRRLISAPALLSVFCLFCALPAHAKTLLMGLAGSGGGGMDSSGLTFAGTGFSRLDLATLRITSLSADSSQFVATAYTVDPTSSTLYMEKQEDDGFHLIAVSADGVESDIALLPAVFKMFTYDPVSKTLFGLAGLGGGGLNGGLLVSGTGFWRFDLSDVSACESGMVQCESELQPETSEFIGTAFAFNANASLLYLEKQEGDDVHLVSVDSTGNESEIALLSPYFQFFIYVASADALIGLSGSGGGGLSGSGLTVSGTGFSGYFVTQKQPFSLTADNSQYEATAVAFDAKRLLLYLERQESDGFHLVSISTLGSISDLGLLPSVFKIFALATNDGKSLGCCPICTIYNPDCPGAIGAADPIAVGTGNLFEQVIDYTTARANPLAFIRYYNSMGGSSGGTPTYASTLGTNWRSNYDRYLHVTPNSVVAERADGRQLTFTLNGSAWTSDSDVDITLSQSGSSWVLTDRNDTVETYNVINVGVGVLSRSGEGLLSTITLRNGYKQTLSYNSNNLLISVVDSYNRSLQFTYNTSGLLETVTTPDTLILNFTFTGVAGGDQLTSIAYNTSPVTSQTYLYENSAFPFALTGITDENGDRYATWTYDSDGRGTSSQHGNGADLTTLTYNSDGTTTVTNALGVSDTYTFTELQGVPKVTQISRAATSTTAAATEAFTYDSNGYLASTTDWNGNKTTYANDTHGDPTTINEAAGTSVVRTTTIAYDKTWVHLPATVATFGLTTTFTYDGNGEILTKTLTDTTTGTTPYPTKGQTRIWTNTWSNFLLASIQTPNGNTTKSGYDSSGALTSITDALGHVTNITSHTGGGYPETIADPNNVTTTLTYDPRLRLTSSTVSGSTGTYKSTWQYDAVGDLITATLPDNSFLTSTYDTAHRLTQVTDALGSYTSYTLDALGDRTQTGIYNASGTLTWQRNGSFDALGRLLVDTAGAGQTTTRTFDPNGNVLTVTDGLNHTTTNTYDALNRLSTSTDANGGVTSPAYDAHDRIVSVTDANGNATFYTRDGFGDVIQQTSPDSGTTVYHYDGDTNLTSKTDALGIVTNQTFDALDRPLTTTYPAGASENVAYTYDQTGTGFAFGVGRLTSVSDAAGSLTRKYEERGNLANETRVNGATTLSTSYTYDGASRVASMAYPDGTLVAYQRDSAGYVANVSAQLPGSSTAATIATISHQPFGPMNAVTYGNGVAETWTYDNDYRATNIADVLSSANLQNLSYAYDSADNVTGVTDAVNPANGQTLGYDTINRLTSAVSGSGGYGSYAWTYDKVGNRLTQVQGSTTTNYGYTSGTNRLASISSNVPMASLKPSSAREPSTGSGTVLDTEVSPAAASMPDKLQGDDGEIGQPSTVLYNITRATISNSISSDGSLAVSASETPDSTAAAARYPAVAENSDVPLRLFSTMSGPWRPAKFVSAEMEATAPAVLNSPIPGTVLNAGATTFTWTGGTGVAGYDFYLGTTGVGSSNLYNSGHEATTSASVNIPADGLTVYARLWSEIGGAWQYTDYTYTESGTPAKAVLSSPMPGTVLNAGATTFTWTGGTGVAGYDFYLGTTGIGSRDLYNSGHEAVTSASINIPADGLTVYARLWSEIAGAWQYTDYTYTESGTPAKAVLSSPMPGTVLGTGTINFQWTGGTGVAGYDFYLGTTGVGSSNLYNSGHEATTSASVNIPADGLTVYARLWSEIGGVWQYTDYTYTESGTPAKAVLNSPMPGTVLSSGATTFTWTSGTGVSGYDLYLGTTGIGSRDLYNSGHEAATSASVNIPADGLTVYARLWSEIGGVWQYTDYTYTEPGTPAKAVLSSPMPGTVLGAGVTTFTWTGGTGVAGYDFYLGTTGVGSSNLLNSGHIAVTSATTTIPTAHGGTIYARLWSEIGGAWQYTDYTYEESGGSSVIVTTNANGNITSIPPANSTNYATFAYNNANRLASVTGSPLAATFVYDWAGQRFSKTDNGSAPILYSHMQGGTLIAENDNGTVTDYVYADGRPIAILKPEATTPANQINYVHTDRLGTPQVVSNHNGRLVWNTMYQPFGTTGTIGGVINQNLRLPGQNFDVETGFSYNLYRDYVPFLGRYLESDPIGLSGGPNTFVYGNGNPILNTDPVGLSCVSTGGTTTCRYPGGPAFSVPTQQGFSDFDGSELLYHKYDISRPIGCANPSSVMQALINNPTPGNPSPATPSGTSNNAVVFFSQPNPVTSFLTTDLNTGNPLVVNITGPNSLFSPGYVAREVINGEAHTYGEGLNWKQSPVVAFTGMGLLGLAGQELANQLVWGSQMSDLISQCGCSQ